jgi:hypothetical protein
MRMKRRHSSSRRMIASTMLCSRRYSCHSAARARSMHSVSPAISGSPATRSRTRASNWPRLTLPTLSQNVLIEWRIAFSMSGICA